jgi:serine/threonine-protein phosphatase 6 regulatory ankyrin repeat subunit B
MNGMDTTGYFTPLIATILIESIPMLCLLLTNQCQNMLQLNQMNKNHETALHIAVKLCLLDPNNYRYVILAAILLRNGANRYAKDKFHESPVSILQNIDVNSYHPSQLNENQRNHYYHASCISTYQQMIINENISIPYLENDLFIYEFFEGMNSQNVLGKRGNGAGGSSSGEGNNPADYSRRGSHGSGKRLSNTRGVIENGLSANVFDDRVVNPHDLSRPHDEDNLNNLEDSTKSSTMSSTVNSYQNYALFYMKLLILNDPFPAARDPHHHQQQQQHPKTEEEDLVKAPPIYDLARNKDIYGLKVLLLQGIDINTFSANKGYNPLISAVYNKDYEMIELLLKNTLKIYQLTDFNYQVSNWFRLFHEFFSSIISNKNDYLNNIQKLSSQLSYNKDNLYLKFNLQGKGGMTALHYASQLGDIKIVGLLLQYGAIRDIKNTKGHIPLDIALANGNIDCANALRFDPAKVSICLAAKHGDWLVMKALLSQGISINTIKEHYSKDNPPQLIHELYTPLIAAISHGQLELVKNILDEYSNEINVNQCNLVQQSPLMYASILGDENIVVKLLKMGANRYHADKSDHTSSYYAKEISKNENIYQILINDPAQVFIHDIIRKNEFPGVVAMLKQGIDPNQKRYSSSPSNLSAWISHDTSHGNKNQQLQRSVSNLDQQKRPSSMKKRSSDTNNASNKSNSSNQENDLLKQINGDDNLLYIPGETPLIIACRYNCIEIARLLCKAPNIDINLPDENGNTPLFHAALKGHEEIVLLLIKQKTTQRKFMNKHKQTALDYALIANHLQIAAIIESDPYCVHIHDMCEKGKMLHVVALLKQGCPPNYRDERLGLHSQTPLMAAASGGKTEIIRMLLRYPEVMDGKDDRDSLGRTALMRAAGIGALDCTAILLNAGCDRNLVDNSGMSAKDHASRHSYSVMFQFMSQTMIR